MGLGRVKKVQRGETGREPTQERRYRLNLSLDRLLWFARSAVSDLVAPMRTPQVWIAAIAASRRRCS